MWLAATILNTAGIGNYCVGVWLLGLPDFRILLMQLSYMLHSFASEIFLKSFMMTNKLFGIDFNICDHLWNAGFRRVFQMPRKQIELKKCMWIQINCYSVVFQSNYRVYYSKITTIKIFGIFSSNFVYIFYNMWVLPLKNPLLMSYMGNGIFNYLLIR